MNGQAKKKGVEALFATREVVGSIGACATKVSNSLIKNRRNADRSDVAITKEFGNELGVAFIGFDTIAGFDGDE